MGIRASGRALAFFCLGHRQRCALPSTNYYIDVVWCQEVSAGRMVRKLKAYLINLLARAARSPYFALDTTYHEHEIPDLLDTTDTQPNAHHLTLVHPTISSPLPKAA